jgi:hypothetical protein
MPAKTSTPAKVFQMKVTLVDSKPPIWRRILVGDTLSLGKFHELLQIVMGWSDSHLHMFRLNEQIFGAPEDDETGLMETKDERKYKLSQFPFEVGSHFVYEYDFGDGWEHKIVIEKILPFSPDLQIPVCLKGKRACPPEDIGGVWGYIDFLEELADPDNPEREDLLEWIGEDFDPEAFDLDGTNAVLKSFR